MNRKKVLSRELLTPAELMAWLKVNQRWIDRHIESGDLKPIKVGRLNRFDPRDIEALLERMSA